MDLNDFERHSAVEKWNLICKNLSNAYQYNLSKSLSSMDLDTLKEKSTKYHNYSILNEDFQSANQYKLILEAIDILENCGMRVNSSGALVQYEPSVQVQLEPGDADGSSENYSLDLGTGYDTDDYGDCEYCQSGLSHYHVQTTDSDLVQKDSARNKKIDISITIGENMRSKSFKKLLESEIERAEIILAAKSLVDKLQDILEDLSKMKIEELGAVVERIKAEVGLNEANKFNEVVSGHLDQAMDVITSAKDSVDTEALKLSGDVPSDAERDFDSDKVDQNEFGSDDVEQDIENELNRLDLDSESEQEPLGRIRKESIEESRTFKRGRNRLGKYSNFEKGKSEKKEKLVDRKEKQKTRERDKEEARAKVSEGRSDDHIIKQFDKAKRNVGKKGITGVGRERPLDKYDLMARKAGIDNDDEHYVNLSSKNKTGSKRFSSVKEARSWIYENSNRLVKVNRVFKN